MEIYYRTPQHCDAQAFWDMLFNLDRETSYMLYEPDERGKSLDKIEAFIDSVNEGQDFLRVAVNNGEIVGYISAQRGRMSRIKHTAYITVGIRSKHRGQGIGTEFFQQLDTWAQDNHISRLELTVMCPNTVAKHLYEKSGFVVEGTRKKGIVVEGEYVDEFYMAKLL